MTDATTIDLGEKLHKTFHLAGLRMLAEMGLTGVDQSEALRTIRHYDQLRQKTGIDYRATYGDRVRAVEKKLIRQAGEKNDNFQPKWGGRDVFDKTAMRQQAQRQVRFAHQTSLSLLDTQETRDLEAIAKRAEDDSRELEVKPELRSRQTIAPNRSVGRPRPRD